MSRLKATGNSHKKKSTTYESKRSKPSKQLDRQRTFFDTFRKEYVSTSSTVNNDEDQQLTDNETEMQIDTPSENMTDAFDESEESTHDSDDSSNDSEENELEIQHETITIENNKKESVDGKSFLKNMQSHEYWETGYPFKFYSTKEKVWLCKICSEYDESEYWYTKAVKVWEHPNRTFLKHQESVRYVEAMKKRQECKSMLKQVIYKQMHEEQRVQKATIKARIDAY